MKIKLNLSDKPYPRRCAECNEIAVQPATVSYDASIKHDGKVHDFSIDRLPVDQCGKCHEVYMTNESSRKKSRALCEHLGLVHADDIRRKLSELGLSQRCLASHLRVAEETVSRWVNGLSVPSKSLSVLMQLYFNLPEVRQALSSDSALQAEHTEMMRRSITIDMSMPSARSAFPLREFPEATLRRQREFELNPAV
ncbi:hypothetical protein [Rhodopirellula bahusiensis]|uniref:Uncharacterized protein n=1 Tax=Rhodopirellula bahusiensis TaxID=2014065 RepID=A0A2G1W5T6_9BACT|nr:hypothetical protein [Rhodopirellula bahusiensis]PHQ34371.1 hypothetical protein CEE69_15245 [Rhodopirellula bahusiensis]